MYYVYTLKSLVNGREKMLKTHATKKELLSRLGNSLQR